MEMNFLWQNYHSRGILNYMRGRPDEAITDLKVCVFADPYGFQRKFKAQCHDGLKPDLSLETRQPSEQNMTKFTLLLVAFPSTGAAQKAAKREQGTVCILLTCFHQTGTCISLSLLSQSNTYITHRFSLGRKLKPRICQNEKSPYKCYEIQALGSKYSVPFFCMWLRYWAIEYGLLCFHLCYGQ